jgi:hypothetical protein
MVDLSSVRLREGNPVFSLGESGRELGRLKIADGLFAITRGIAFRSKSATNTNSHSQCIESGSAGAIQEFCIETTLVNPRIGTSSQQ